jgi:hypothetical protein
MTLWPNLFHARHSYGVYLNSPHYKFLIRLYVIKCKKLYHNSSNFLDNLTASGNILPTCNAFYYYVQPEGRRCQMPDKKTDSPEEKKQMTRRRLLKLGVYAIPAVTTIVALSDEALGQCGPPQRCTPKCGPANCVVT